MDFNVFRRDVSELINLKKAIGLRVAFAGLLVVIASVFLLSFSEKIGLFILSIGMLFGFAGLVAHFIMLFNLKK